MKETYIAALDLGTSKMVLMLGRKDGNGQLTVIDSETIETKNSNCVRRGYVFNVNETAARVKVLIDNLNRRLERKITRVYVGVGGQSLHTEQQTIRREVPGGIVTQSLLDELEAEARASIHRDYETLDVVSPLYLLDSLIETQPLGVACSEIEARYQLVLGRPMLKENLRKSLEEKAGITIAGFLITPLATALACLGDTDKELGCALVECGAGVTYLSTYKGGLLRSLVTIPLGSDAITRDIVSLNVTDEEAESLKLNYGKALVDPEMKDILSMGSRHDGSTRDVDVQDVLRVIEARTNEILENVKAQIEEFCPIEQLGNGIILTGGAIRLGDFDLALRQKLKTNVRIADVQEPQLTAVKGMLKAGEINCVKEQSVVQQPVGTGSSQLFPSGEIEVVTPSKTPKNPNVEDVRVTPPPPNKKRSILDLFDSFTKNVTGDADREYDDDDDN